MIHAIETFYIHTIAYTPAAFTIHHTVWTGGWTIHATIALSDLAQGLSRAGGAGSLGAHINSWGHLVGGREVVESPPPRPENVEMRIANCTFVTFGLTAEQSEGHAVGTVYYLA